MRSSRPSSGTLPKNSPIAVGAGEASALRGHRQHGIGREQRDHRFDVHRGPGSLEATHQRGLGGCARGGMHAGKRAVCVLVREPLPRSLQRAVDCWYG